MPHGRRWSRDELLVAMNLYCRLPFGQLHQRNPLIITVAARLGRTPGALAMKLCNLASLDPAHRQRGVRGLTKVSATDRAIWQEFHASWELMGAASEVAMEALLGEAGSPTDERGAEPEGRGDLVTPAGPTQVERLAMARRGQTFFRRTVLASYSCQCAVTGNPVPQLLIAAHILPWAQFPEERVNPHNGICLAAHFDRAFDSGLITFDDSARLVVSRRLRDYVPNDALEREFLAREGCPLRSPNRFRPPPELFAYHRDHVFVGRG